MPEWAVLDYDGNPLPVRYPTEQLAIDEGLCGRYLLSGFEVVQLTEAPATQHQPER